MPSKIDAISKIRLVKNLFSWDKITNDQMHHKYLQFRNYNDPENEDDAKNIQNQD